VHDIRSWTRTIRRYYTAIAILTLNTLVIVICLAVIAAGLLKSRADLTVLEDEPPDARALSPYYTSKAWAPRYWKEFALARKQQYHAFSVWRRSPFKGETINVDERGVRVTPGARCGPGSFKVFTFGSSHMWGTGAPDWGTIPAYVQTGLEKTRREPVCVTNFGESGYVTTQSVIELMLQLQTGNIPNVCIFMDGAGDIYAGYQSGKALAVHENFDLIAARVQTRVQRKWPLVFEFVKSMSLFQVLNNQVLKLAAAPATQLVTYESMNVNRADLANSISATYLSQYETVSAIAQRYGFEAYFFWPAHISSGKKVLTSEEETLKGAVDPPLMRLYGAVYQAMEPRFNSHYKNLIPITDVFDDYKPLIWLDDSHTTPVGNEMIAQRMLSSIDAHRSLHVE
jgi:hypothetical protein